MAELVVNEILKKNIVHEVMHFLHEHITLLASMDLRRGKYYQIWKYYLAL